MENQTEKPKKRKPYRKRIGTFDWDGKQCRVTSVNGVVRFKIKGRKKPELEVSVKDIYECMQAGQLMLLR